MLKNYYALNAMIVCDADLRILNVDATFPGSVHDSFVWRMSFLREAFLQGHFPREDEGLLGDSGYPLEPWLLNPVPGNPAVGSDEAHFNQAHRSARSVVERCIGMLKNRFRCLQRYRTLHYDSIRSCNIVTACSILHNVCLYINAPEPTPEPEPVAVVEPQSSDSSDSDSDDPLTGSLHDRGMVVRQRKRAPRAQQGVQTVQTLHPI
ncbi:putative nuclease HARBI1 [Ixodes scapularis]|uniref:putative nuclease HARBI1 n=1 Tax=Ixodes scapularis TaxID=6945 RepID=UPI001C3826D2|nr:putative nuclease HARBI1 [Ixodes scapularis]